MGTANTPGYAISAGGEDRVSVFAGFGAVPVAVLDTAPVPFNQRVMELAIPAAERANAAVATDMGVSGSALKRERHSSGMSGAVPVRAPFRVSAWYVALRADPGRRVYILRRTCIYSI